MTAFATLRNLVRKPEAADRCDMCGTALLQRHQHLIDPSSRRLFCTCDACATLFYGTGETKLKRVPRGARRLEDFHLPDGQWDSLLIPIGLAFFLESSVDQRVRAFYPSPGGATESLLSLEAWIEVVADNPMLADMNADVEALLVNRLDGCAEYYLAPIDKCYELVGKIRRNWHGLSGGEEMWSKVREFFAELKESAVA